MTRRQPALSALAMALVIAATALDWSCAIAQQTGSDPAEARSVNQTDATMESEDVVGRKIVATTTDLFGTHSWYKAPPPPPPRPRATVPRPPAPRAPALPFTYLGRYVAEGAEAVFIVSKADRVYDVHIGDVIDSTYSVDSVENGRLMFTYLPLQERQGLPLGESE